VIKPPRRDVERTVKLEFGLPFAKASYSRTVRGEEQPKPSRLIRSVKDNPEGVAAFGGYAGGMVLAVLLTYLTPVL
jgi:hypothetical protein